MAGVVGESTIDNADDSGKAPSRMKSWIFKSKQKKDLPERLAQTHSSSPDEDEDKDRIKEVLQVQENRSEGEKTSGSSSDTESETPEAMGHRNISKPIRIASGSPPERDTTSNTYISSKSLPKLPRVEPNSKGNFLTSTYKCDKPLSFLQIRVRMLKYPSGIQRTEWPDDMLVLEDRLFYWQEKVFSKSEAQYYKTRRNIVTVTDEQYYKELINNPKSKGKYFHTYVQRDFINTSQITSPIIKRCANKHSGKKSKLSGNILEPNAVNSDGESVLDDGEYEDVDYQRSIIIPNKGFADLNPVKTGLKNVFGRGKPLPRDKETGLNDDIERAIPLKLKQNLTTAERKKADEIEADSRNSPIFDDDNNSKKGQIKNQNKSKTKKRTGMLVNKSPPIKDRNKAKGPKQSKSAQRESIEEILEPRVEAEESEFEDQNQNYIEPGTDVQKAGKRWKPTMKGTQLKCFNRVKGFKHSKRIDNFKTFRRGSQSMYIVANIPHMTRRKRTVVVCSLQTYPRAGVLLLKPDFGYRILEAKRNHVYYLSWELYTANKSEEHQKEKSVEDWRSRLQPDDLKESIMNNDSLAEQIGDMFEIISAREMRLVVFGEILTAYGFEHGPMCIQYFVETPKGWRNDHVSSSLIGITHRASINSAGYAYFSHHFSCQLVFSMDSVHADDTYSRPNILLMVVSTGSSAMRYEGYAYVPIPSQPGHHVINIQTWKLGARDVREKMMDTFLDITPSLDDIRAVHIPINENEECRRPSRLGLKTIPSGSIKLRLHVLHQTHPTGADTLDKMDLLEKMSSTTILHSIQNAIAAFQRARRRAYEVKNE